MLDFNDRRHKVNRHWRNIVSKAPLALQEFACHANCKRSDVIASMACYTGREMGWKGMTASARMVYRYANRDGIRFECDTWWFCAC